MAAQDSTRLMQLLNNLNQQTDYPLLLYCDNQSAIQLAENSVFHAQTKHVEVHHHFVREKVIHGAIAMKPIKIKDQVVEIFTKSLNSSKFMKFQEQLGITIRGKEVSAEGEC